jgi:hypothetical protein
MSSIIDPVMREAIAAAVQAALAKQSAPVFKPAVVVNIDVAGVIAEVQCDGPDEPIFGAQLLNTAAFPGDRVEIMFVPPSGAFVIGRRGGDFDPWHMVGHPNEPAFLNAWRNIAGAQFPGNDDYAVAMFRRVGRIVELRGQVEFNDNGDVDPGPTQRDVFSLPPDYRPENDLRFLVVVTTGLGPTTGAVDVFRNGLINVPVGAAAHLDGIMYSTNPASILEDA